MLKKRLADSAEILLTKLDVAVRRRSCLGQHRWLRKVLLGPYRKLINLHGRGVVMNIGGCIPARMPSDYAWKIVEAYEPESLAVMKQWLATAKEPLVVDVGCALGFVSCAALFGNPDTRVIAIDSDLPSVKITQLLCAYAPRVAERLSFVWGFVSNSPTRHADFRAAHRATLPELARPGLTGNPNDAHYTCLDGAGVGADSIARYCLDDLIPRDLHMGTPVLIKCDVEGAELLVLHSAVRLLAERSPALLLSVHPTCLPTYGVTPDDVRSFLTSHGYRVTLVAIDHEEHWWCVKEA